MVIKDFGVFRQEWVMESWANMIIASPLIVWVCVVASFYRAVTGFTSGFSHFIGKHSIFSGGYLLLSHWVQTGPKINNFSKQQLSSGSLQWIAPMRPSPSEGVEPLQANGEPSGCRGDLRLYVPKQG